jgi:hypothetical protein
MDRKQKMRSYGKKHSFFPLSIFFFFYNNNTFLSIYTCMYDLFLPPVHNSKAHPFWPGVTQPSPVTNRNPTLYTLFLFFFFLSCRSFLLFFVPPLRLFRCQKNKKEQSIHYGSSPCLDGI